MLAARASLGRSAFWRTLESIGSELVSFAGFSWLAHLIAPTSFGVMALAGAIMVFMQVTLQHGFTEALIQRDGVEERHVRAATTGNLLVALLLIAVGALLAHPLGTWLHRPELPTVLWLLLPTLLFRAASMPMLGMLRRSLAFRAIALRTLLATGTGAALAVLLATRAHGIWALVVQQWTVEVVGFLVLSSLGTHKPWHLGLDRAALKELFPTAVLVVGSQLLTNAARRLDAVFLGFFVGNWQLGIYFMVYRLSFAAQQVTQNGLGEVALSVLSRARFDRGLLASRFREILRVYVLFCCLVFGCLAVSGPWLVPLVFGASWTEAGVLLRPMALFCIAGAVTSLAGVCLLAGGEGKAFARLTVGASLFQLAAIFVSARWGLRATVFAAGAAQIVSGLVALALVRNRLALSAGAMVRDLAPSVGPLLVGIGAVLAFDARTPAARAGSMALFVATLAVGSTAAFRKELRLAWSARFARARADRPTERPAGA